MAGFGVLIVSGILSAIFLFFIAVFAAAAAYIMASYVLEGFSIACMRKKAGDAHTFPAWIPFYSKYLLGKLADRRVMGAVSALLTLLSVCLCVYFYVCRELNTLWFILLLMALLAVFILDTLIAHKAGCVGMAANMIGVCKRIIAFDNEGTYMVMFNPVIVRQSGPYEAQEGCLSLSGVRKTKRFQTIKVQWQNEKFQTRLKTFTG